MTILKANNTIINDNSYFRKIFSYFATTTIILFTIITLIIGSITLYNYNQEIKDTGMQNLDSSIAISESTLNRLYNYCYILYHNSATLNNILYAEEFSPSHSIEFAEFQNNYLHYSNLIDSIYLINFNADFAFSTLSTCESLDAFYDQKILSILKDSPLPFYNYFFLPRSFSDENEKEHHVITMIFRNSDQHAFVINIDYEIYNSMINNSANDFLPSTLVMNHDGVTLNCGSDIPFQTDVTSTHWYVTMQERTEQRGSFQTRIDGKPYLVLYQKDNSFQFTYCIILKYSLFGLTNTLFYSTIAFFVVFVIISLGVSLFVSYKMYQPIQNLFNTIRDYKKEAPPDLTDEMAYLSDTVAELVDHYRLSQKKQKQLYLAQRNQHLLQLITVKNYDGTLSREDFQKYNLPLDGENYLVILFSLDRSSMLISSNPEDYNLLMYSMENIVTELLSAAYHEEHSTVGQGNIAYILPNMTDNSLATLQPLLTKAIQCMEDYFHETITISVGEICDTLSELHDSYQQARLTLRYRFLHGGNCILKHSDVIHKDIRTDFDYQQEKKIIAAVTNCKQTIALNCLSAYFDTLSSLPIDHILLQIMSLNLAFQVAEQQAGLPIDNCLGADSNFYDYTTLSEIHSHFQQRICNDIDQLSEIHQNQPAKSQLIEKVITYVNDHLCSPQLTVEHIAAQIDLSTNYLRSIFKEHMGISLSKYIADQKIQYACKILAETDDSIQLLCEQLDFTSANYFYTYFKKHTGMTPNQYRETYRK